MSDFDLNQTYAFFSANPTTSYVVGRLYWQDMQDILSQCVSINGTNAGAGSLSALFGSPAVDQSQQLAGLQTQLNSYKSDLFDTASHADTDSWSSWGGFQGVAAQIQIEANAIQDAGSSLGALYNPFGASGPTGDVPTSIGDITDGLSDAGTAVANAVAPLLPDLEAGGVVLVVVALALLYVYASH
jgi:hypothetical protein